jgi:hypothetical protein
VAVQPLRFALALVGLFDCEQRFSSTPPLVPDPAPSSSAVDALLAPRTTNEGPAPDRSHAMTVTLCSSSPQPCPASDGDASAGAAYLVVFGSGHGVARSREQATTDLYQELRNRMSAGERLDVEPRAPSVAGTPIALSDSWTTKATAASSDPLAQCAVHLLLLVDRVGEVALDVEHGVGSTGCLVSLGHSTSDGGTSQCLVQEPERAHGLLPQGKGLSW